ncbi:MAG: hypothetical protein KIS86_04700 [Devosia sp.]|nr:hypothetical protein [Devosia sp.]
MLPPHLIEQGNRYAWFVVTSGNHQIAANTGANTFAGGSKFVCTDGIWSQGSTTDDFSFRYNGAKFEKNRTVVEMNAAVLPGGFTELRMVFQGWEPAGTQRSWEIKPFGVEDWIPFDARPDNPLANLPAQASLRMVMQGTEDLAPMIILDTHAVMITGRMRNDLRGVSKDLAFGFATETIEMIVNMDAFDIAHHDLVPRLRVGAAVVDADSVTATVDPTKPSRTTYKAIFDFAGAPITGARVQLEGNTDTVVKVPFVQDIQLNAF